MEQERLEKQEYLKTEILEKNYSPDEFMEYCEELKGAEIDMYTLAELKTIVNDFISRKSQIEEISVPESFVDPPVHQAKVDLRLDPQFEKRSENSAYSISAIKMHDNALSLEDVITITVSDVESVSGGMLTTKYVYPVTSQPFNWKVKRSIEEFIWLKQVLSSNFPGVYLPPSPPKRFRSSPESQYKQKYFLERFINSIVRSPLLRRSIYLQSFLMEEDPKLFQELKKKSNKDKKQNKLEDYWTLDGTVICDPFNDESEKVAVNEYLNVSGAMKKKLKRQSDTLIAALKEVSNLIMEIAKSYEILENVQSFVPEITGTRPLYNSLKSTLAFWADHETKSANLIQDYFNMFCKYGYYEIAPLKDIFKERDQKFEAYEKTYSKLIGKKEKLWSSGDVNKWGLTNEDLWNASVLKNDKNTAFAKMLNKETNEVDRLKDEYAYFNFQSRSEVRRFLLDNQLIENVHFTEFARAMCTHTTKIHVSWGELIANLSQIRSENIPSRSFISKHS